MRMRLTAVALGLVMLGAGVRTEPFQDKSFESNGIRIRYIEAGSGTPVVLIHGYSRFLESNWINPGLYPALCKKSHRVIAYDLPGHGKSGKSYEPSAYRDMAGDPIRLMDHLGIRRAHLIGYSLGGGIVTRSAVPHPERLITAILGGHSGYRDWEAEDAEIL